MAEFLTRWLPARGAAAAPSPAEREVARLEGIKQGLLRECYGLVGGLNGFAGDALLGGSDYGPDGFAGPGSFAPLLGRQGRKDGGNWPVVQTEAQLDLMRAAARWLADTNSYAIGFLGHLTHFTVGKGFAWQVVLRGARAGAVSTGVADADGDGAPDTDPAVEACQRLLDDWRAREHWGPANAQPDPDADPDDPARVRGNRETEAFRRAVTDGECNLRLFLGGRGEPPTMRAVEPELIGGDTTAGPDAWGKRTAAGDAETLTHVHVWAGFDRSRGEWVPARRLVTHKRNVVASVKRGVTDFLPVGEQLGLVLKLNRNMGIVACIVAAIAYIRQHPAGVTDQQVTQMIQADTDYETVRGVVGRLTGSAERLIPTRVSVPGEVVDLNKDQVWVPPPLVAGVPGFVQAQQAMLRGIGTRWCAPEYFSGDSSNANFASTLVSGSPFVKAIEAAQEEWAGFEAELACRVLEFSAATGCLPREHLARVEVKVVPPAVALADKAEDTQRREVLNRNKVLSPQTWAVQEELDPRQEFANFKAFEAEFPDASGGPTPGLFGDDGPGGGDPGSPPPLTPEGDVTEAGYAVLAEAARTGLTRKVITNKLGNRQVVYVRPQQVAGGSGSKGADHDAYAAARTAVAAAVADPGRLHPGHLDELAGHLDHLSKDDLKGLARQLEQKVGGKKVELADRILAHVRSQTDAGRTDGPGDRRGGEGGRGTHEPLAAGGGGPAAVPAGGGGQGDGQPDRDRRAVASAQRVGEKLARYTALFRAKGHHQAADWLDRLKAHVAAFGPATALAALGEDRGGGPGGKYEGWWAEMDGDGQPTGRADMDRLVPFATEYLRRHGVGLFGLNAGGRDQGPLVSSSSPSQDGTPAKRAGDFAPADPTLKDKLDEAKRLPGLESSEDLGVLFGKPVTHLTPAVAGRLDETYGPGRWIVKAYGDDAAAGYGIFFPQRAEQLRRDAQGAIWDSGRELARYGFGHERDAAGTVVGVRHAGGDVYRFGTPEYETTVHGEARKWGDVAARAAADEHGAALPGGGKEFMAQPAFPVVGVSDADRAKGVTIKEGQEGRVHVVTRNGKAEVVPHATWLKGHDLPVVFETDDTRAMAKAAQDAIDALPASERRNQIYAPDVVKTADGYKVVEANPANSSGSSGYLGNSPFVIDSYVSHLTGRTPAHVRFVRALLTTRKGAGP